MKTFAHFRQKQFMWSDIWNISYIELRIWNQVSYDPRWSPDFSGFYTQLLIKLRSSQLWTQFKQLRIEAWKSQDFNGDQSLLDFKSAVQYMEYFIYHFKFIPHGLIKNHKWPAPKVRGFITSELVKASHRYREVTGWNPVEVLTISGFYTQWS